MKNLISLLIITFSLLILSNEESNAQCSPCSGTLTSTTINYPGGCNVVVTYCYDVSVGLVVTATICEVEFSSAACLLGVMTFHGNDIGAFWSYINDKIMDDVVNKHTFPPCPVLNINMEITKAVCWARVDDPISFNPRLIWCNDDPGLCMTGYKVCYNGGVLQKTIVIPTQVMDPGGCTQDPELNYLYNCSNHCIQ